MVNPSAQTTQLVQWLERMRDGDHAAWDELIRSHQGRLELLARKMLRRNPKIGRWVEAEHILQNVLLRLLRALEERRPTSMRRFFGLAAEQMRRELVGLARHLYGPQGEVASTGPVWSALMASHLGQAERHRAGASPDRRRRAAPL